MNTTDKVYLRLAKTGIRKCLEVERYYRRNICLGDEATRKNAKRVLVELRKIRQGFEEQPQLNNLSL